MKLFSKNFWERAKPAESLTVFDVIEKLKVYIDTYYPAPMQPQAVTPKQEMPYSVGDKIIVFKNTDEVYKISHSLFVEAVILAVAANQEKSDNYKFMYKVQLVKSPETVMWIYFSDVKGKIVAEKDSQ